MDGYCAPKDSELVTQGRELLTPSHATIVSFLLDLLWRAPAHSVAPASLSYLGTPPPKPP